MPYKILDHTADLAFRVEAESLEELFEEAGKALFSEILGTLEGVEWRFKDKVRIEALGLEELLVEWLRELLFRFDALGKVYSSFEVHIKDSRLEGELKGEELDPTRHKVRILAKGITYHLLSIKREREGFVATFLVDI